MRQDAREAAAFIRPMLEMDPEKRASAQEMLDHPWLEELGPTVDEVSLCTRLASADIHRSRVKSQAPDLAVESRSAS